MPAPWLRKSAPGLVAVSIEASEALCRPGLESVDLSRLRAGCPELFWLLDFLAEIFKQPPSIPSTKSPAAVSSRVGPLCVVSPRVGSICFSSPRVESVRFGSRRVGSNCFSSPRVGSSWFRSPRVESVRFGCPRGGSSYSTPPPLVWWVVLFLDFFVFYVGLVALLGALGVATFEGGYCLGTMAVGGC